MLQPDIPPGCPPYPVPIRCPCRLIVHTRSRSRRTESVGSNLMSSILFSLRAIRLPSPNRSLVCSFHCHKRLRA